MYTPHLHEETNLGVLHALVRAHPLGTWATLGDGELLVNHVPFYLDAARGPYGTLLCHVARANPVWKCCSHSVDSVVSFQGAAAYISPSWYASKSLHGKVVPTWNYAVVHAHGIPVIVEDPVQLHRHLSQLTDEQERAQRHPWSIGDAPGGFIDQMIAQVVGIEIPIARLFGKWKVSQNRSAADRLGVVAGLTARAQSPDAEMAGLVAAALDGKPAD
jgi:transcriptional regulator